MTWHGYALFTVTTPLTDPQKVTVRNAILSMGVQKDLENDANNQPNRITQFRASLDKQSAILEVELANQVTKSQVVTKLANALGVSEATVDGNTTFQAFGSQNSTWEESRQACLAYLSTNNDDWQGND